MVLKYTRYVLEKQKKNYYIYYIMHVRRQKGTKDDAKSRKRPRKIIEENNVREKERAVQK